MDGRQAFAKQDNVDVCAVKLHKTRDRTTGLRRQMVWSDEWFTGLDSAIGCSSSGFGLLLRLRVRLELFKLQTSARAPQTEVVAYPLAVLVEVRFLSPISLLARSCWPYETEALDQPASPAMLPTL